MPRFYRRRFRIRKHKPLPFRYLVLLTLVFFILSTAAGLWIVNKAIKPVLVGYVESQSFNIANYVINQSVKEEIGEGLNLNDITIVTPSENSEMYSFDWQKIIEVSNRVTNRVLNHLTAEEDGYLYSSPFTVNDDIKEVETQEGEGIYFKVPIGRITNNILLGSIGPDIPVQFQAIGDIDYDIDLNWEELAINSTWYEISLKMRVNVRIIVPFMSKVTSIEKNIPLAAGTIKGQVPQFYSGDGGMRPSIPLPADPKGE